MKCVARVKTCRNCKYRYEAGDKSWLCPKCGEDRYCTHDAIDGYNVCGSHGVGYPKRGKLGGRPPVTGKYGKYSPERLLTKYAEFVENPEYLAQREEIAILETRIAELFESIEENPLMALKEADRILDFMHNDFEYDRVEVVKMLERLTDRAIAEREHWRELIGAIEARRKLIQTESKRLVDMEQLLTKEQALTLLLNTQLVLSRFLVEGTIVTRELLNSIRHEFRELVDGGRDRQMIADKGVEK